MDSATSAPRDLLRELAAKAPEPKPRERSQAGSGTNHSLGAGDYTTLNAVAWFGAHGAYGRPMSGDKHAVLCPWAHEHSDQRGATDSDTTIWEAQAEQWPTFHCLHAHCVDRTIADVMQLWGDADRYCEREFPKPKRFGPKKALLPEPEPAGPSDEDEAALNQARQTAAAVVAGLKNDRSGLFLPAALEALALVRKYDFAAWVPFKETISAHRLIRDLEKRLPSVSLPTFDQERAVAVKPRFAGDMLPDCPAPSVTVPEPYFLTEHITGRLAEDDDGTPRAQTVAFAPVLITGRTRNVVTGAESLLIAWKWTRSGWMSRIIDRSHALSGRKLIDLAAFGFPVGDDSTQGMVSYLHRLEACNRPSLPCAAVTDHLGWQGEAVEAPFLCGHTLVRPDGSVEDTKALDVKRTETWNANRIFFHGVGEGEEQIVDAFRCGGSFEGWVKAVSALQQYPKVLIGLYAAFVPPLLEIFNVPNFVVDWSNRTSTGKTTTLRTIGSVWGNPDERTPRSVIGTWDATRVWTERASQVLSGLPLIMDDTKKAKSPRMIADLIYAVVSGRGRGRGNINGISKTGTWRTVMFSTGEQPATSYTQDGGTRTRVLSIRGIPFGEATFETGQVVKNLNIGVCQHYGHAGIRFMQWLLQHKDSWPEWRAKYQSCAELYSQQPPTPEAGRLAQYAALVSMAGRMAHDALGLPWTYSDPLWELWKELATEASDADGEKRALEDVCSWAFSHEHTFIGRFAKDGYNERTPNVVSGRWDSDKDWAFLAFYPNVLKDVLRAEGYEPEAILSGWRERKWIKHEPNKYTWVVKLNPGVDSKAARMTVIMRAAINALGPLSESDEAL